MSAEGLEEAQAGLLDDGGQGGGGEREGAGGYQENYFNENPLVVIKKAAVEVAEEFEKFQIMNSKLKGDYIALFDPVGLESNAEMEKEMAYP